MPWDYSIKKNSFGTKNGELEHWWDQHVIHPTGLKVGEGYAFVAKIEGRAANYIAPIPNTPGGAASTSPWQGEQPFPNREQRR